MEFNGKASHFAEILILAGINVLLKCQFAYGQAETASQVSTSITANTTALESTGGGEGDKGSSSTTSVVVASVIAVCLCITIVIAVYFIKKRRESRMMDKEKKMQIQMSSARNAGVYQDLTVSVPADEKLPASPEHERLRAAEDA